LKEHAETGVAGDDAAAGHRHLGAERPGDATFRDSPRRRRFLAKPIDLARPRHTVRRVLRETQA
jgi:hypothetical protein